MRTVANSSPDCRNMATSSTSSSNTNINTSSSNGGPNRNNGHENRNQTNRNSLLHGNGNESWGEDMISTLALSASLLSPKTPTPTAPTNKRPTWTNKTAVLPGNSSEYYYNSTSNILDLVERPSSSAPRATTSSGLFTPVSQATTLHSSALLQSPMSTATSPNIALAAANAGSSACRSANISSTVGSSPGKNSPQPGRRLATLNYQLQRSTIPLPSSGSCLLSSSSDLNTIVTSNNNNSMEHTTSHHHQYNQRSSPPPGHRKAASSPFGSKHDYAHSSSSSSSSSGTLVSSLQMDIGDSSTMPSTQFNQQYQHHPLAPSAFILSNSVIQAPFGSTRVLPSSTHTDSIATSSAQPPFSSGETPLQPAVELTVTPDTHSGVIMASPGPGLSSSTPRSISPSNKWHRLVGFVRAVVSHTLVSRLFSRRPNYSSGNISSASSSVNSWSVIRILNTCHLLYLIPVTSVTIARVLTTEVICNEQLFGWLTVQGVLFMLQIICACYILQRQTMSSRIAILDQRSRILLLVFVIWTIIGVGFLGADNANREPSCMPSNDPVFGLAFKIIVFHSTLIGFYFLPCSSFLLSRVVPTSISSGLSRTATKPMIDKLSSTPMTEGMFGGDPEEAICAICLGDYAPNETIRFLPCRHHFHLECVDQWLLTDKSCPLCKHDIDKPVVSDRNPHGNSRFQATEDPRRNDEEANNNDHHHTTDSSMASDRFQVIVA